MYMVLYVKLKYVHYFGYATYTDLVDMLYTLLYTSDAKMKNQHQ